ncbi:MAG: Sec-independent protein translocase TatB [Micrococcales bacterium]
MFGLSGEKLIILGLIAAFVLGPERLPGYAQKLAQLVKSVRRMAEGAKTQLSEEMGEEFEDLDWKKLDPRQYDPRRIIRDALREEGQDLLAAKSSASGLNKSKPGKVVALADGEAAPFDSEST